MNIISQILIHNVVNYLKCTDNSVWNQLSRKRTTSKGLNLISKQESKNYISKITQRPK